MVVKRVTAYCPYVCHKNDGYIMEPKDRADNDDLQIARSAAAEHTRKMGHETTVLIQYSRMAWPCAKTEKLQQGG